MIESGNHDIRFYTIENLLWMLQRLATSGDHSKIYDWLCDWKSHLIECVN